MELARVPAQVKMKRPTQEMIISMQKIQVTTMYGCTGIVSFRLVSVFKLLIGRLYMMRNTLIGIKKPRKTRNVGMGEAFLQMQMAMPRKMARMMKKVPLPMPNQRPS